MTEAREPDERFEADEVELGEPTESVTRRGGREDDESVPDPAERDSEISTRRKPMGPPLEDPPTRRGPPEDDDEPRSPPIDPAELG